MRANCVSKLKDMSRVNEIEEAVLRLTAAELDAFRTWFAEFDATTWDRQIEDDVAAGRLDGFFVTSQKPWDVAAGALLIKEAGGRVGDFAGGVDFLRAHEVIAAAPGVFTALREAIAKARRP